MTRYYGTFAASTPTPAIVSSSSPLATSSCNASGGRGEQVARAQAGVQLRESARSLPVEVVVDLGVDDRAEQEREVAVLG